MHKQTKRTTALIMALILITVLSAAIYMYFDHKYNLWFPSYIKWSFAKAPDRESAKGPIHILFLVVDHFEPGKDRNYLSHWLQMYRVVASKHKDADGCYPKHVFAYPVEQFDSTSVVMITKLCQEGYGEIELQLHHFDDTEPTLREKFAKGIANLQKFGWFLTADSVTAFSFVHGNWALDDSRYVQGRAYCGVPSEISLLKELGCYLDVTFPSIGVSSQPSKINSIYYSTDDPKRPKSYDTGVDVQVGKPAQGDLMHLEGPLLINWSDWRFKYHPTIEDGALDAEYPPSSKRADLWVKANVHVIGQPNWTFIKIHAHGAHKADSSAVWGWDFDSTLSYLERKYNDGTNYVLHYITAREAYNIVKAAEAGQSGNPDIYRNYIIKPYAAESTGCFK